MQFNAFILTYLHLFILTHSIDEDFYLNETMNEEERNQRCCKQHLDCCSASKAAEPTNFEVRALLVRCPKPACDDDKRSTRSVLAQRKRRAKSTDNDDETCPRKPPEVTNCNRKLKLTIKVRNTGVTNCKNQYIIIDHVFDPLTEKTQKLANPYVLKVKQQPVLQTYGLTASGLVNFEAKEKVVNKDDEGYTGCSTDPHGNPTCGSMKYDDEVIPFSTGFCCSCDQEGQNGSSSGGLNSQGVSQIRSQNQGDAEEGPRAMRNAPKASAAAFRNTEGGRYESSGYVKANGAINGKPARKQKRGGQDCSDTYAPPNANPESYHQSAHCLEFSDLWYTVYRLDEPKLYHSLQIQLYEKVRDPEGNFKWRDLTKTNPIEVGTYRPHFSNEMATVTANYAAKEISPHMFSINYKVKELLVPEITRNMDAVQFPSIQGGPKEYLVVDENKVQPNGKMCDVAGVGYEAFAKQPQRCNVPKGTCLKNQPKDLWEHDREAEEAKKRGTYFLKYYGLLPENPIFGNQTCQNKTLVMYYTQCHTSVLDLEVKADDNLVMRSNSLAVLTEVLIDSSGPTKTTIIARVFNSALVASIFMVRLSECPMDLPASFSNIVSKPVLIPPQHVHQFSLEIRCSLPLPAFFCTMQVLNSEQELIAVRKIRLLKGDRCICIWHCRCACLLADEGLKCKPLTLEHYHAAGFQGGLPIPLHVVRYTLLDDMLSLMMYILLFVCLTLLLLGLIKAIVGIFVVLVGLWGLDMILELPKMMNKYYEPSLKDRKVVYDENGWPVHPDTGKRVRNVSTSAEFCINVVFFFIYPLAVFWCIVKKLCFGSYETRKSQDDICVCGYGSDQKMSKGGRSDKSAKSDAKKAESEKTIKSEPAD